MYKTIVILLLVYSLVVAHNSSRLLDLIDRVKFVLLEEIKVSEEEKEEIGSKTTIFDDVKFILLILVIVFMPIVNLIFAPLMYILVKLPDEQFKYWIEESLDKVR